MIKVRVTQYESKLYGIYYKAEKINLRKNECKKYLSTIYCGSNYNNRLDYQGVLQAFLDAFYYEKNYRIIKPIDFDIVKPENAVFTLKPSKPLY